jgi:hypothetical protein
MRIWTRGAVALWLVASAVFIAIWWLIADDPSVSNWIFAVVVIVGLAGFGTLFGRSVRANRASPKR